MAISSLVQEYPQFVANQVLTQDQLNQLRTFLDSQNRATRVQLIGTGIVCGLQARVEVNGNMAKVIVSAGYGVSTEGWLLCLPEALTFTEIHNYTDPD
ncbi:MAG: hypothetical protein AAGD05_16140, partial [Bacteroidota bacterium]